MSAHELTNAIVNHVENNPVDFICLNYANTDMVGHTGDFGAAMKAAETVDGCLKTLMHTLDKYNFCAIVIADHGNSDYMINENGSPNTAHTTNLVPCFLLGEGMKEKTIQNGKLADIAPTILDLMNITQPGEMTGKSLIK